jgi:hypothetical protein
MEDKNPHYVTPEAARNKICPIINPKTGSLCKGDSCMAWRWRIDKYEYNPPDDAGFPVKTYSTIHGYCGMVRHG